MDIRPYVVEVCFAFAAGVCVGAWMMERRRLQMEKEKQSDAVLITEQNPKEKHKKEGYFVRMEDGKVIIDPSKRKRWFFF